MASGHHRRPPSTPSSHVTLPATGLFLASQEMAPGGFTVLRAIRDADGDVVDFEWEYANPAALRALKAYVETLLGRRLLERFPGNRDHPQLFPRYVQTLDTGESSQVELVYTHEGIDGVFRNAVSRIAPDLIGVWFEEITDSVRSEQALRTRIVEIEALYQHAPVGLALFNADLNFVRINETLAAMNGVPPEAHIGKLVWEIVPSLRESAEPKLKEVLKTGRIVEAEISGETPKSPGLTRWWHEKYYPLFAGDGTVSAIGAVVEEITERKAAENILQLSSLELRHRIKNLMSVVTCLATQTFPGPELAERRRDFEGRLRALDQANSMLGDKESWGASEMSDLLRTIFAGNVALERIKFEGPPVHLDPRMATAFSMTMHELTTNAMKYGALKGPNGRVAVTWTRDPASGIVELLWREAGGPPVEIPATHGFGSRLITQMMTAEGGSVDLRYHREGVECTLRFKTAQTVAFEA